MREAQRLGARARSARVPSKFVNLPAVTGKTSSRSSATSIQLSAAQSDDRSGAIARRPLRVRMTSASGAGWSGLRLSSGGMQG
jgi:hypothetical protein